MDTAQASDAGNVPTSSSQVEQAEGTGTMQDAASDVNGTGQGIEDASGSDDDVTETATIQSSQQATVGSTIADAEQVSDAVHPPSTRNHLRNYTIGTLHLDSYVDI